MTADDLLVRKSKFLNDIHPSAISINAPRGFLLARRQGTSHITIATSAKSTAVANGSPRHRHSAKPSRPRITHRNFARNGRSSERSQKRSILAFTTWCTSKRLSGLCSLLGVTIELPEFPLSFAVAIQRMGGFVLVVLAHSMQSPFYVGCFRSTGLRLEQLRELE